MDHRNQNRDLTVADGLGASLTCVSVELRSAERGTGAGVVAVGMRCQQAWVRAHERGFNACAGTRTDTCSATSAPYESVIVKLTRPNHRPSVERAQRFSRPGTRPVATRRPPGGGSSAPAVPSSGGPQNASRSIQTGRSNDGSGCACDADQGLYTASPRGYRRARHSGMARARRAKSQEKDLFAAVVPRSIDRVFVAGPTSHPGPCWTAV